MKPTLYKTISQKRHQIIDCRQKKKKNRNTFTKLLCTFQLSPTVMQKVEEHSRSIYTHNMLCDPANAMKVLPKFGGPKIKALKALIIVCSIFKKNESLGHKENGSKTQTI